MTRNSVKRLTYHQFDKQEEKLRAEGWQVVEVKEDYKIVILEKGR